MSYVPRHHPLQRGRSSFDPDRHLDPALPQTADWGEYDVEDDLDELDLGEASYGDGDDEWLGDEIEGWLAADDAHPSDHGRRQRRRHQRRHRRQSVGDEVGAFWHSKERRGQIQKKRQKRRQSRRQFQKKSGLGKPKWHELTVFSPTFWSRQAARRKYRKANMGAVMALRNERQAQLQRRFGAEEYPTDDELGFLPLLLIPALAAGGLAAKGNIRGRLRRAERKIARGRRLRPRLLRRLDMDKDRIIKRLTAGRGSERRTARLQDWLGRINAVLDAAGE